MDIDCPAFPNTGAGRQPDWDYFAWNSFFAANWPAIEPGTHNWQRGFPDLTQRFTGASPGTLLVWETFKEKRELFFPPSGNPATPKRWNYKPDYSSVVEGVPLCPGTMPLPQRLFIFDSLDEIKEVPSEALESQQQLCGNPNPFAMCGTQSPPDCCRVQGLAVSPRVWKGSPTKPNPQPVLYEVKINWDYFNYIVGNKYYLDATAQPAASNATIQLPYRTSAMYGPSYQQNPSANQNEVVKYQATSVQTSAEHPNPIGSVQLKAAWMLLQGEDRSKYHIAKAAYFKTATDGTTCMSYGTFGLVGLHIIQRVHGGLSGTGGRRGGTFIFATWEHVDNDSANFTYSNYFKNTTHGSPASGYYPPLSAALDVKRKYPILKGTKTVNDAVHTAIRAVNPNSVWLNYQLIGTQFQAIDVPVPPPTTDPNDPTGIGQPLFLANLLIETNDGLQNFQGLPPNTSPIGNYSSSITANTSNTFNRQDNNVTASQGGHNMGGCMGCHGVAQSKGYSFSFVLLNGQNGAIPETPKNLAVPLVPTTP